MRKRKKKFTFFNISNESNIITFLKLSINKSSKGTF